VVDETRATRVAALICGERYRPETRDCPGASVGRAQTGGELFQRLPFDMEREFLVELAFDAGSSHQRAKPQEDVGKGHARLAEALRRRIMPASSRVQWPPPS